jgi:oligosaccharyl transferase (archaeosortase A-associated)
MNKSKITILIVVLLALFFGLSLLFRVVLPYDSIFTGSWIKFSSTDSYYHMRFVDNLVHNFPHITQFDPFYIYPGGGTSGGAVHFFDYLIATVIWIIGMGSPTQHTVDVVGVYIPTVLAALTVIPVFFIGKALFNRWVGLLAAFLTSIMAGEFLGRSILGFAENHVAETLFSTVTVLFLILAIKAAGGGQEGQKPLTFERLFKGERQGIVWPLVYSLLAGLFLGIYLITWMGALLFVFIFTLYLVVQFIMNHLRQRSSDHLGIIGFIVFLVGLIIFVPISPSPNLSLAMVVAVFIPLVLAGVSRLMSGRGLKPAYYPLSIIAVGAIFLGIFYAIDREMVSTLWQNFLFVFSPGGGASASTTMEMQPLLSPYGSLTTSVAWGNFTTGFFLTKDWAIPGFGIISFIILIWQVIKSRGQKELLSFVVIWTLVIMVAALVQRRFAYYLVVNIALLTAYISWQIIWLAGLKKLAEWPEKSPVAGKAESSRAKRKRRRGPEKSRYVAYTIIAIIVVFPLITFWNVTKSKETASVAPYAPSDGWMEALSWMKDNTPDPLGDPNAYYELYGLDYQYPASAYGVTAWWDYGYWISRVAHRLPSTNPSQDPGPIIKVANLFLTPDEATGDKIMDELKSSYIIIDFDMINAWSGKFHALVTWADLDQGKYINVYYAEDKGSLVPWKVLLNSDYYRTLAVRLYNFNGKAVSGENTVVVTYNMQNQNGASIKVVTKAQQFATYQEAQDYIASEKPATYDIAGNNPFVSPVPLEAVKDYKPVYNSYYNLAYSSNITVPEIKVFEKTE